MSVLSRLTRKWGDNICRVINRRSIEPFIFTNVELGGLNLQLLTHKNDSVIGAMLRGEKKLPYDSAELGWLHANCRNKKHLLDAGGNLGYLAISLAKAYPSLSIYSFEPDPLNYSLFQLNMRINRVNNICLHNFALGSSNKLVRMFNSPRNFGDHRTYEPARNIEQELDFQETAAFAYMINGFEFFKVHYPEVRFDIVKIDTQGADFEILSNITPLLQRGAKVNIELSPYHVASNGTNAEELESSLSCFASVSVIEYESTITNCVLRKVNVAEIKEYFEQGKEYYKHYYNLVLEKQP